MQLSRQRLASERDRTLHATRGVRRVRLGLSRLHMHVNVAAQTELLRCNLQQICVCVCETAAPVRCKLPSQPNLALTLRAIHSKKFFNHTQKSPNMRRMPQHQQSKANT